MEKRSSDNLDSQPGGDKMALETKGKECFFVNNMYESYWHLKEKPFENTPDPRFFYFSEEHKEALSRLTYAVQERKGAALLTGDYGCGKTVISRLLFERLPEDKYCLAFIANPLFLSPISLLREICHQLDVENSIEAPKDQLLKNLNERFYENLNANKDTVIIIDEAHAISSQDAFEELRLLLNFQLNHRFLLTLILIGQSELREKVNELKSLKQRLAIKFHLNAFLEEDTKNYVSHRLQIAGASEEIFTAKALHSIWTKSGGIPRVINNICDLSLLIGFSRKLTRIDEDLIDEVAKDLVYEMKEALKMLNPEVNPVSKAEGIRTLLTIQGNSAKINGEFLVNESIEIDCEVQGKLEVQGKIIIQKNGFVKAEVKTESIEILGRFEGSLEAAGNVDIKETGSVFGNIKTDSLIISKGGVFSGNVERVSTVAPLSKKDNPPGPRKAEDVLADHEPETGRKLVL
jgi:general secretion pathway protein A